MHTTYFRCLDCGTLSHGQVIYLLQRGATAGRRGETGTGNPDIGVGILLSCEVIVQAGREGEIHERQGFGLVMLVMMHLTVIPMATRPPPPDACTCTLYDTNGTIAWLELE